MTRQRRVILDELRQTCAHPTAEEVYDLVRKRIPRISLGTVYRNLELLAQSGLIQRLESGGPPFRFDGAPQDHCHARCVRCGRMDDVEGGPYTVDEETVSTREGFQVLGCRVEFQALCPECAGQIDTWPGDSDGV